MKTSVVIVVAVLLTVFVLGQWDRVLSEAKAIGNKAVAYVSDTSPKLPPTPVSHPGSGMVWTVVPAPTPIPMPTVSTPSPPTALTVHPTPAYTPIPNREAISLPVPSWFQEMKGRIRGLRSLSTEIQTQMQQAKPRLDYLYKQVELTNYSALPYAKPQDVWNNYKALETEYYALRHEHTTFSIEVSNLNKVEFPTEKEVKETERLEEVGNTLLGKMQALRQRVEIASFELPQL